MLLEKEYIFILFTLKHLVKCLPSALNPIYGCSNMYTYVIIVFCK